MIPKLPRAGGAAGRSKQAAAESTAPEASSAGLHTDDDPLAAALAQLVQPHGESHFGVEQWRALASLGMVAWNIALMAKDDQPGAIAVAAEEVREGDQGMITGLLRSLVKRKRKLFRDNPTAIEELEVTASRGRIDLRVTPGTAE